MGGILGGGLFGGKNKTTTPEGGLGAMMLGRAAGVDGINTYQPGVDPAISAAKNIWGDPAVTAAENIWGESGNPGAFDVGGALYSPYNGHVDRMADRPGYKTRHMREGGLSRMRRD